ncbi:MAG: chorismate synthase [Myxococcales bacterium]|nr:chorismate synthase [Myxococcales bacterium]
MGSSSGVLFKVTTFGESHGPAVGAIVEGCPPNIQLDLEQLQNDLDRRRPGQSHLTTSRSELDRVEILSGLFEGKTTGTPIALVIKNQDARSRNYDRVKDLYRPGHGDASYIARYGIRDYRGGGRASARETAARVAAAAIARQYLRQTYAIEVLAWVDQVYTDRANVDGQRVTQDQIDSELTRCPDPQAAQRFEKLIVDAKKDGDTLGGIVSAIARNVPAGWGSPVFDKLEADLAKACLSLPACKGFDIGSGFEGVALKGSEHNDAWKAPPHSQDMPIAASNRAGGTLAGISTGAPIELRCAFKPVSTHFKTQNTVNTQGKSIEFKNEGRHDPCVLPRAVPLVEAAILLTLMDHALRTLALHRDHN